MDANFANLNEYLPAISAVFLIAVGVMGALLTIFVFGDFFPRVRLRIIPSWENRELGLVKIRMEIENYSKVVVPIDPKHKIMLQVLPHNVLIDGCLSEWVEFDRTSPINLEKLETEPIKKCSWRTPIPVFVTTEKLYPGEIVSGERLHYCPSGSILHIALQVHAKFGPIARMASYLRKWQGRWTTTVIVVNDKDKSEVKMEFAGMRNASQDSMKTAPVAVPENDMLSSRSI